ncbi:MAG: HD domain-containing protein [Coriobacteriales bacterium]|jgi:response regulator RpfG family c-di-GMP phosphodiesterase|nr:HD domain-containing protein [Coriobacteriales bacterium]
MKNACTNTKSEQLSGQSISAGLALGTPQTERASAVQVQQAIARHVALIDTLAKAIELRPDYPSEHMRRCKAYMGLFFDLLKKDVRYAQQVDGWDRTLVVASAQLHDIGKFAVPSRILNKPGRLSAAEFDLMSRHASIGRRMIQQLYADLPDLGQAPSSEQAVEEVEPEYLRFAECFAYSHHERWDGSGYPEGLRGSAIPLPGRMMALIDVYDALTSIRPYKPAFSHERALAIIKEGAGKQFDPGLVEVFAAHAQSFAKLKLRS